MRRGSMTLSMKNKKNEGEKNDYGPKVFFIARKDTPSFKTNPRIQPQHVLRHLSGGILFFHQATTIVPHGFQLCIGLLKEIRQSKCDRCGTYLRPPTAMPGFQFLPRGALGGDDRCSTSQGLGHCNTEVFRMSRQHKQVCFAKQSPLLVTIHASRKPHSPLYA